MMSLLKYLANVKLKRDTICLLLNNFKGTVDPLEMIEACDSTGVSREAYIFVYNIFKNSMIEKCGEFTSILPTPCHIKQQIK